MMTGLLSANNEGDFGPPTAFAELNDDDDWTDEAEDEAEEAAPVDPQDNWQEEQSNKLKNILNRRRSVGPTLAAAEPESRREANRHNNMRKSKSHGEKHQGSNPPLRRRERSPKESTRSSSPRENRKVRAPSKKGLPRRSKSMDVTKNFLNDDDSLNSSLEFNVKEPSPVTRRERHESNSNPRLHHHGSNPRIRSASPSRNEARRQKMMTKRKNSLKAGSLRRLIDAESAHSKKDSDDLSIDDTVLMDDSDEQHSGSKNRRGQRPPSSSKRDLLKKSMSDKPDRTATSSRRRKSFADHPQKYQSNSFCNSSSKIQRMKELRDQHYQAKQQLQQDDQDQELSLEELQQQPALPVESRTKLGIENLANLGISQGSSKHNSFNGSWRK